MQLKHSLLLAAITPVLLSGCGETMYEKCIKAENTKILALTENEFETKFSEEFSPLYNPIIESKLADYLKFHPEELKAKAQHRKEYLKLNPTEELQEKIKELEATPELVELKKIEKRWLSKELTIQEYFAAEDACPKCKEIKQEIDKTRNEMYRISSNFLDERKKKFRSVRSFHEIYGLYEKQLNQISYKEMFSYLDSEEKAIISKEVGDKAQSNEMIEIPWQYGNLFSANDKFAQYPENASEEEKDVIDAKNDLYEASPAYAKDIKYRMRHFIGKPSVEDMAVLVCNERGLYE